MPTNWIQQSQENIIVTNTSVTLGYNPGNTEVPTTLILWAGNTATVTLPPINTALPASGGGNYVPGSQALKIQIKSLTGQVVNVSAASSTEVFFGGDLPIVISSTGAKATFMASPVNSTWYLV